jgi:hypothetical protein
VNLHDLSTFIDATLASAGLDPKSPLLANVSETVRSSLAAAGIAQHPLNAPA